VWAAAVLEGHHDPGRLVPPESGDARILQKSRACIVGQPRSQPGGAGFVPTAALPLLGSQREQRGVAVDDLRAAAQLIAQRPAATGLLQSAAQRSSLRNSQRLLPIPRAVSDQAN